jgi:hypothetical protein
MNTVALNLTLGSGVGHLEEACSPPLRASIPAIVTAGRRSRSMPRHLLHGGQVDTQVEQVPDPSPAQVMRSGGLELGLETALTTDPPGAPGAEASHLITLSQ